MPRTSSGSDETPDEPAPEPQTPDPVAKPAVGASYGTAGDMNEAMEATQPDDVNRRNQYPPGADQLTDENVRRYPELFTDAQIATVSTDELPETDIERAQAEAAEATPQEAE